MSTAWSSQQQAFAAALLNPRRAAPGFLQARPGAQLSDRFDIYRNNVQASLIEALHAAFPVCAQLVGEDAFRTLARAFLRRHLPTAAALHDYGAALPRFIAGYAPAACVPYLADVAALEQAWWQSYGAADAAVIDIATLVAFPAEQLLGLRARPHPATRLLKSAHPVCSIWLAHQGAAVPAPIARWEAECTLVTRPDADVQVRRLAQDTHHFLTLLERGATLAEAAAAVLAIEPSFDLGTTLRLAIEAGAIQELHA
jgi:hypothetical protein